MIYFERMNTRIKMTFARKNEKNIGYGLILLFGEVDDPMEVHIYAINLRSASCFYGFFPNLITDILTKINGNFCHYPQGFPVCDDFKNDIDSI